MALFAARIPVNPAMLLSIFHGNGNDASGFILPHDSSILRLAADRLQMEKRSLAQCETIGTVACVAIGTPLPVAATTQENRSPGYYREE